jgi:hypothetical protein
VLCGYAVVLTASFAQTAHPTHSPPAVTLFVAVLTVLVLSLRRVWQARYSPSWW